MKTHGIELLLTLSLALGVFGCGESGPVGSDASVPTDASLPTDAPPPVTCGASGRTGQTDCAVTIAGNCPSGQYCDNVMLTCSVGCTSDDNCSADEHCVRAAGEAVGACAACATCGDGICQPTESVATCPADCGVAPVCGDGTCHATESVATCPADCGTAPTCGDGTCQATESAATCPADCGGPSSLEACVAGCDRAGACGADPGLIDGCRADCGILSDAQRLEVAACNLTDCRLVANCFGAECFTVTECGGTATCINGGCCGNGICGATEAWTICPADCGDQLLPECLTECEALGFFGCGGTCAADCRASTPPDRERFLACSDAAFCNYDTCSGLL